MAAGTAAAAVTAVIANDVSNRIAKYGDPVKVRNSAGFHKLHLMLKGVAVPKHGAYDLKTLSSDPTSDKGATGDSIFFNTLLNNIDGEILEEVLPLISHPNFQLPQTLPGGTFYKILYELNMEASDKLGDTLDSGAAFLRAPGRVEGETFGVYAQRIIAAQASFAKNNPLLFKPAGDTELAKDLLPKVQDELLAIVCLERVNKTGPGPRLTIEAVIPHPRERAIWLSQVDLVHPWGFCCIEAALAPAWFGSGFRFGFGLVTLYS